MLRYAAKDEKPATVPVKPTITKAEAMHDAEPAVRREKRPVTIRLDVDIIERFKATGRGWQTRMNDALRSLI